MHHRRLAASVALGAALATGLLLPATASAAPPVAANDQAVTNEETTVTIDLLKNDTDPDGDRLHIDSFQQPASGTVALAAVGGFVLYTPNKDFYGQDRFFYTVADDSGGTSTALVAVFVNGVNDPPVASDRSVTVAEDGSASVLFVGMDPDKERCDLRFVVELRAGHGSLTPLADGGCTPNGDFATSTYTPDPDYSGPDQVSYVVSDGLVQSAFATISITVTPVNDRPVALAGSTSTTSGVPVTFTLRATDVETCDLLFNFVTTTPHGKLVGPTAQPCTPGTPNADAATVTYTPLPDFVGIDTLTFVVGDGTAGSVAGPFSIMVTAPPTAHVGDLDGSTVKGSGTWQATATVRIDGAGHAPQAGAIVRGTWSTGLTGTCTTSVAGACVIGSGGIARKVQAATFTVTSVTSGTATYDPSANHDPDGDSTGTSITIARP